MSLLNELLPQHHFAERHEIVVDAPPHRVLDAVLAPHIADDAIVRAFIALREWPHRMAGRLGLAAHAPREPFGLHNFVPLGCDADRELAFGVAGRFWRADYGLLPIADARAFVACTEPGVAKLVMNFSTEPHGSATRLVTCTRVFCSDAAARRRFLPYWLLIRPASGLIRRRLLARIKRAAESP